MEALRFLNGRPVSPTRLRLFLAAFAVCGLALFAATWKLWTLQTEFPQVPLIPAAGWLPKFIDWLALGGAAGSLVAVLAGVRIGRDRTESQSAEPSRLQRWALAMFASCAMLLFLVDQHRLQPWAFQFAIFAVILSALPSSRAWVLLRCVVVSIYFWSALAKIDFSFLDTLGQQFLATLAGFAGLSIDAWPTGFRRAAALAFPLAELLIAIGLCLPLARMTWLRRMLLVLIFTTHGLLILALCPMGMNHRPGVILWNVWFMLQAWLLVARGAHVDTHPASGEASPSPSPMHHELVGVVVEFFVAAVIVLPALNLANRYDHWLAWGLYAPRNSRATLYLQSAKVEALPQEMRGYVDEHTTEDGWRKMHLDQWSLDALSAPIYPQDRFQVAVAAEVVRKNNLQNGFQIVVESPADRWTGRRSQTVIRNGAELENHRRQYLLGATARP